MTISLSQQSLSELIGRIYDCTLDPSRWDATLEEIRLVLDCQTAVLHLNDLRNNRFLISKWIGVPPELQAQVAQHLPEMHTWLSDHLAAGFSLDEPLVVSRRLSVTDRDASAYIRACWKPNALVDTIEHFLLLTPTRLAGLGLARHERQGMITNREAEIGRLIIPHVRRAVTISNVLDVKTIEAGFMTAALDALKVGVVLTSEDARIVHANRAAESMMRDGTALQGVKGRVGARQPAAAAELREAVSNAARNEAEIGSSGLAVRLSDDHAFPMVAHVLPLANGRARMRPEPDAVAAIFVSTPIEEAECAAALARAYKLTPSEARVLEPVLAGRTVPEAATDTGIATSTARTHLNNIFAKTGVSRQSNLIRLAASLAPAMR